MASDESAPPPKAEEVRRNPKEEVLEVLDFYKFALKRDARFSGTVVFDVAKSDTNPAFVVSIRVNPATGVVEAWEGLPPDGHYKAYTEINRDDFFFVYSGKASVSAVGTMCLTGRIKVRWFRYHDLQSFASSFDYSTPTWIRFYRQRGQEPSATTLLAQQWRFASKAGKLVSLDGAIVDPAALSWEEASQLRTWGAQLLGTPPPSPSLPASVELPPVMTDDGAPAVDGVAALAAAAAAAAAESKLPASPSTTTTASGASSAPPSRADTTPSVIEPAAGEEGTLSEQRQQPQQSRVRVLLPDVIASVATAAPQPSEAAAADRSTPAPPPATVVPGPALFPSSEPLVAAAAAAAAAASSSSTPEWAEVMASEEEADMMLMLPELLQKHPPAASSLAGLDPAAASPSVHSGGPGHHLHHHHHTSLRSLLSARFTSLADLVVRAVEEERRGASSSSVPPAVSAPAVEPPGGGGGGWGSGLIDSVTSLFGFRGAPPAATSPPTPPSPPSMNGSDAAAGSGGGGGPDGALRALHGVAEAHVAAALLAAAAGAARQRPPSSFSASQPSSHWWATSPSARAALAWRLALVPEFPVTPAHPSAPSVAPWLLLASPLAAHVLRAAASSTPLYLPSQPLARGGSSSGVPQFASSSSIADVVGAAWTRSLLQLARRTGASGVTASLIPAAAARAVPNFYRDYAVSSAADALAAAADCVISPVDAAAVAAAARWSGASASVGSVATLLAAAAAIAATDHSFTPSAQLNPQQQRAVAAPDSPPPASHATPEPYWPSFADSLPRVFSPSDVHTEGRGGGSGGVERGRGGDGSDDTVLGGAAPTLASSQQPFFMALLSAATSPRLPADGAAASSFSPSDDGAHVAVATSGDSGVEHRLQQGSPYSSVDNDFKDGEGGDPPHLAADYLRSLRFRLSNESARFEVEEHRRRAAMQQQGAGGGGGGGGGGGYLTWGPRHPLLTPPLVLPVGDDPRGEPRGSGGGGNVGDSDDAPSPVVSGSSRGKARWPSPAPFGMQLLPGPLAAFPVIFPAWMLSAEGAASTQHGGPPQQSKADQPQLRLPLSALAHAVFTLWGAGSGSGGDLNRVVDARCGGSATPSAPFDTSHSAGTGGSSSSRSPSAAAAAVVVVDPCVGETALWALGHPLRWPSLPSPKGRETNSSATRVAASGDPFESASGDDRTPASSLPSPSQSVSAMEVATPLHYSDNGDDATDTTDAVTALVRMATGGRAALLVPQPRPPLTLGAVVVPGGGRSGGGAPTSLGSAIAADAHNKASAEEESVHLLPIWHPRRLLGHVLTTPGSTTGGRNGGGGGGGNHSPTVTGRGDGGSHNGTPAASQGASKSSAEGRVREGINHISTTSSSGGGGGVIGSGSVISPWVAGRAFGHPHIYNAAGSAQYRDTALHRLRLQFEDAMTAAAAAATPASGSNVDVPAVVGGEAAAATANGVGFARPPTISSSSSSSSSSMYEYRDTETVPYGGRAVSQLLRMTPLAIRDLARRVRERRMLKVYGGQQQQAPPPPQGQPAFQSGDAAAESRGASDSGLGVAK